MRHIYPVHPLGFYQCDKGRLLDGKRQNTRNFDYNVTVTRKVCEMAHPIGVSVESELGCLGSLETGETGKAGEAFGCAGQGSKIKPVAMDEMAKRYWFEVCGRV